MAIFCTKCGTKNEDVAAFCENCGAQLRRPAMNTEPKSLPPTAPPHSHSPYDRSNTSTGLADNGDATIEKPKSFFKSKPTLYAGAALTALLVVGGGVIAFVLQPPAATSNILLAAAKEGYGKTVSQQYKHELCMANMDYNAVTFNAGENDQRTQAWLNALVGAGLYSPPIIINSGGFFPRNLLQYATTPVLAQYREGSRLCLAKAVEIADVVDIEKPLEESFGRDRDATKVLTVKAKLALQATDTAPWLDKSEIRDVVLAEVRGWEYKDKKLQKKVSDTFGLRDRQWATGPAYKSKLEDQYRDAQHGRGNGKLTNNANPIGIFSSLGAKLSSIFSLGGHPLKGTWRMDTEGMGKSLGMGLPSGLGFDATMTFTSDSIDFGGQSMKCKFEVDGKRVKVTPQGQGVSLIFVMQDKDTAIVDMGLIKMQYRRVE